MTRHHLPQQQSAHYARAKKRITNLVAFAWLAWHLPDLNQKLSYERS
jgi:hypothetical protein